MIKLIRLNKTYQNNITALSNVTLHIKAGEFVFLVGPTGSGKSTLVKLLHLSEMPTNGEVWVFGQNIRKVKLKNLPALRQKIGVIFQDFKVLPQRTVWENVAFPLEILGTARREQEKKVRAALELTGISALARSYPHQLSGGELQRVSVARAIVNRPPLVLADEPTGNLDPDTSWEIMRLLVKIQLSGTTVVVCTHDKLIVDSMKRRVIALDKGKVVQDMPQGVYTVGLNQ